MIHFFVIAPLIIAAAVVYFAPDISPRHALFGVRVPQDFRRSAAVRDAITGYRITVAIGFFVALMTALFAPFPGAPTIAAPLILMAFAGAGWVALYRRFRPFAVTSEARPIEVDLSNNIDRLPPWIWLAVVPFLLLFGSALYLYLDWTKIPAHFPIHWGAAGAPNGWASRTVRGVYAPLIFGVLLDAWLLALASALWHGVRRSNYRTVIVTALVAVQCAMGLVFSLVALMPLLLFGPRVIMAIVLVSVAGPIAFAFWAAIRANALTESDADLPPQTAWTGGIFYFNRQDPALGVPRRDGLGYAMNFGHLRSWLLVLMPFAIVFVSTHWLF